MNTNKSEANAPQRPGELALQGIYAELPEDLKGAFHNDALVNQSIMNSAEVGASYQRAIESLAIDLIRSLAAERDRLINAHGMTLLNATPAATDKPILEAPANKKSVARQLRSLIEASSSEERLEVWNELMRGFCRHCGSDNPRCQCWNDE